MLTIRVFLTDFSDNSSYTTVRYKVDKTAPQLVLNSLSESTDYTYYGGIITTLTGSVSKNDSSNMVSASTTGFDNPTLVSYA